MYDEQTTTRQAIDPAHTVGNAVILDDGRIETLLREILKVLKGIEKSFDNDFRE